MNPACSLCRGACCVAIVMPLASPTHGVWLSYHGERISETHVELPCACKKLVDGKCSIYSQRPGVCEKYPVGGSSCRTTVRRRRANWREIFALLPK